jgi:type IV secretory pathway protease TraF
VSGGSDTPLFAWGDALRSAKIRRRRQLFLLMEASASFDGRYFGVTKGRDIIGKARLLWARSAQGSNDG